MNVPAGCRWGAFAAWTGLGMANDRTAEDQGTAGTAAKTPRTAVAVAYRPVSLDAPRIKAKGQGHIAEQIIATAQAHGVPIRQDADLATLLSCVDLDAEIPVEAFVAVAEILSYLYRLNGMPDALKGRSAPGEQP